MGAFSVDREGADVASIKTAMQVIQQGRYPLVIFPEGEIWHHHEQLDELNEGVATIMLRATQKLPPDRDAYLVPTAIRYTYNESVRDTFPGRLARLEEHITWKPIPHMDAVDRIYRLGAGLLAVKEEEWLGAPQQGTLVARIQGLQYRLLRQVEEKHGLPDTEARLPLRVKALRKKIRDVLTKSESPPGERETWDLYHDLDKLFVVVQLYSYPGQYLREQPTTDRIAETLLKLEEDVLGEGSYPVERTAFLRFGDPIHVQAFLEERKLDHKTGVLPLTQRIAESIQAMLADAGS
jgi:hypothetical protein